MNALFEFKSVYVIDDSVENISSALKSIANHRWNDFSENITGKIYGDNSFEFYPKWSFGFLSFFGTYVQSLNYITCEIKTENGKTIIQSTARPNMLLVIIFYFILLFPILKLAGVKFLSDMPYDMMLFLVPVFCSFLAAIMIFGSLFLRRRFERIMHIIRNE